MQNTDKKQELIRQIVLRIREVILPLPDTEVIKRMEAAGEQTSYSTVRRLKAPDAADRSYNYNLTIKPYARVFLELGDEPIDVAELASEEEKDRGTLENIIQIKDILLESQQQQIADAQAKIDYLKQQVAFDESQLQAKDAQLIERRDFILRLEDKNSKLARALSILGALLAITFVVMLVAFSTDALIHLF